MANINKTFEIIWMSLEAWFDWGQCVISCSLSGWMSLKQHTNMQEMARDGSRGLTHPGLPVFILFLQVGPDGLQGLLWAHRQRIWQANTERKHTGDDTLDAHRKKRWRLNLELTNQPQMFFATKTYIKALSSAFSERSCPGYSLKPYGT